VQLVLVSGLSGSGKSIALKALEDAGYFAVDNLPATLISALLETLASCGEGQKIAISVDVRSAATIAHLPATIEKLAAEGVDCRLMFLDANDEALTRRFSETRRPHPLADKFNGMAACIAEERQLLADIAALSHRIDTSDVRPNTLRGWVKDWLALDRSRITLAFLSFGFKHGIAFDADFVFDVRFLPNPFYDPVLKNQTGQDQAVKAFFESDLNVAHLIDDIGSFIMRWLPQFVRDNRSAINVAIGCTGGQHRSVYIAEQLAERFGTQQQVLVRHRDLAQ
jgi:RNase adapter protein RapZ